MIKKIAKKLLKNKLGSSNSKNKGPVQSKKEEMAKQQAKKQVKNKMGGGSSGNKNKSTKDKLVSKLLKKFLK